MTARRPARSGITASELLVVLLILGVLVALALPNYLRSIQRTRATEAVRTLGAIRDAEITHRILEGQFTDALNALDAGPELDLALSNPSFTYAVEQASPNNLLVVATATSPWPGAKVPLKISIDAAGNIIYYWPDSGHGSTQGGGAGGSGGGSTDQGGTGAGSGGGGGGGSGGGGGGGPVGGGGTPNTGGSDSDAGDTTSNAAPNVPVVPQDPGATTPNIPDQPFAAQMLEAFNVLANDGALAQGLANMLVLYQIELVFEDFSGTVGDGVGGFVEFADPSTIHLNDLMPGEGWLPQEIAAIMAHESFHVRQLVVDHLQDESPVFWLEDLEGPAYATETLVWDSIRRDENGNIVLNSTNSDWDTRANSYINVDGTIDEAGHNAYIATTRGIPPGVQLW